jgi:twinkle protein
MSSASAANIFHGESWDELKIDLPYGAYGETRTKCPHCSHTRHKTYEKCLAVNVDEGVARCHHCDDRFHVRARLEDQPKVRHLRPRRYARPTYTQGDEDYARDTALIRKWLLRERGIPDEIAERYGIEGRYEWMYPGKGETEGGEVRVVAFPYYRGEKVINIKYRTLDKRFRMIKDARLLLYGVNDIAEERLIWVEGEMDKLSVATAGFPSCVSVPNGAPPPNVRDYDAQFDYLEDDLDTILAVREHIIAVDDDEPGRRLAQELARRLDPDRCKLVVWPPGCKDANDVLVKFDAARLARCIDQAKPFPVVGMFDGDEGEIVEDLDVLWEHGYNGGVAPGDDKLGEYYRVLPGLWTLVTGIPGSGKSEFLNWLAVNLMREQDWRFAICSPENQPIARHLAQLTQICVGKPFSKGETERMTVEERDEALAFIREHTTFILPPEDVEGSYSLDNILALCRRAILRKGVRGIVIDPWNELEHNRPTSMREDEYINRCLVKIKRFAREHQVHIWLVAHPRLMHRKKDGEGYEVPTPYDVSGGGQWRNHAMMALTVHREHLGDPSKPSTIHVQKVKRRELGKIGSVDLWYDPVTGRYSSVGAVTRQYEQARKATAEGQRPKPRSRQQPMVLDEGDD